MTTYQTLLDEAVTLLDAERAFIVLHDHSINKPTEFAVLFNFDAIAAQVPIGDHKYYETYEEQTP